MKLTLEYNGKTKTRQVDTDFGLAGGAALTLGQLIRECETPDEAKLTMTLECNGRSKTIERFGVPSHWHMDYELKQLVKDCERETPGERIRQLFEACGIIPRDITPHSELTTKQRATWEELARLAKRAAERGEL